MNNVRVDTRGFVLPSILLTLVLLLGLVAWSSTSAQLEHRTGTASANAMEAFNTAELGLIETVRTMDSQSIEALPLWGDTTVSGTLSNGGWTVTVTRLPSQLALLRARGTVGNGGSFNSSARELGQIVRVKPSQPILAPLAALTTRGYVKVGGASKISGEDTGVLRSGCSALNPDVAGIQIDDPANVDAKGSSGVEGSPDVLVNHSLADPETFNSIGSTTWDEWVEAATHIIPGGTVSQIEPSYLGADCNYGDPYNWGEPDAFVPSTDPCGDYWPIIYATGSLHVTGGGRGQGILVIDGDAEFQGGLDFYGVVIARGLYKATGNGNNITGAVYAANVEIGDGTAVGRSDTRYSRCIIEMLNSNVDLKGGLEPLERRGWADVSSVVGG